MLKDDTEEEKITIEIGETDSELIDRLKEIAERFNVKN